MGHTFKTVIETLHKLQILSDGSHRLDKYEVQYWLENHGKYITIRQAQKIIDQMDFNGDGMIEYDDFLATILGITLYYKVKKTKMEK